MKATLLKDWGKYKKGETVEVKDKAVQKKGLETGLFAKEASKEEKQDSKPKTDKK